MAIQLEKTNKGRIETNKLAVLVLVILVAFALYFFVFKKDDGSSSYVAQASSPFAPINIDFEFVSSQEVQSLEPFNGIPVLPGFYEASDKQIQPEKINYGRENPFKEVSSQEIEQAILKLINILEDKEDLIEVKQSITNSTLYNNAQKNNFLNIINTKIKEKEKQEELDESNNQDLENSLEGKDEQIKEEKELLIDNDSEKNNQEDLDIEKNDSEQVQDSSRFKVW